MDATLCCDHCGSAEDLYRLLGTPDGLCAGCFGIAHAPAPHPAGCLRRLRTPRRRAPIAVRPHRTQKQR